MSVTCRLLWSALQRGAEMKWKFRVLTVLYMIRFFFDRLTGRSHVQETILLRRPLPPGPAPAGSQGAGTTMILKIRLDGKLRMIVLPLRPS